MNNTNKRIVKARKISYNKYQQWQNEQEEKEELKRLRKVDIASNKVCMVVLAFLFILNIIASINHMQTVNFTIGLTTLVVVSLLICFVAYFILKVNRHGFSDY